jgi:arginyl-tRNA synthetase
LEQLVKEVGKDATRFFYLARKSDQHMDFDIELAKSNNSNNPVYYIQYAYARICSIFRQLEENNMSFNYNKNYLNLLMEEEELSIIKKLYSYPDVIINSSAKYEPHLLTNYMKELAQEIHSYYNKYQVLVKNEDLRNARLALIKSARYVFENSSKIIGIDMPEKM